MSVALGLKVAGGLLSLSGSRSAGRRARKRAEEQRIFDEIAAGQTVAVGQRRALEERRQAQLMASRAVAVAAAGGSVQDIDHLIADIHGEGAYRANLAMYESETEAERIKFQGLMAEQQGRDAESAHKKKGLATVLSIGASFV